jgi:hypothetical protein
MYVHSTNSHPYRPLFNVNPSLESLMLHLMPLMTQQLLLGQFMAILSVLEFFSCQGSCQLSFHKLGTFIRTHRMVSMKQQKNVAAICSSRAAELYTLEVLESCFQDVTDWSFQGQIHNHEYTIIFLVRV